MASNKALLEQTKQDLELHYKYLKKSLEEQTTREHPPTTHRRIPTLPDLRFEYSYLRSVARYVHVERQTPADPKGKGKAVVEEVEESGVVSAPSEVIEIQWGRVLWITTRDQVISPLLQGALWGVVGHFLRPMMAVAGASISEWWTRGAGRPKGAPSHEGGGVGWLRNWIASFTTPSISTSHGITFSR
ncbi:hypothetical protein B0H21DRAFT_756510 [Amylocystis lapponica]|nr:hypothetical protein B0H21DRAFT_756510 [Amylocystis lapponica]